MVSALERGSLRPLLERIGGLLARDLNAASNPYRQTEYAEAVV
jgi:hypothetical protein